MLDAMRELCGTHAAASPDIQVKEEEHEAIDSTCDEPMIGPSTSRKEFPSKDEEESKAAVQPSLGPDYSVFAEDGSKADLRELLECLTREELATLVKEMKLKPDNMKVRRRMLPIAISLKYEAGIARHRRKAYSTHLSTQHARKLPYLSSARRKGKINSKVKPSKVVLNKRHCKASYWARKGQRSKTDCATL